MLLRNLIKLLKISDLFTLLNAASGLLCIFFASIGNFKVGAILLLAAICFDYLDGKSAKKRNIANEFGKQLDSLSDVISFGVAPAVFVFLMFKDMRFVLVYILYLLAGVIRLARFNITKSKSGFEGMPITVNGVLVPVIYFIFTNSNPYIYYIYFILTAFLMVSSIRFIKL